ncbi:hypothetical protein PAECIP111893_03461 [Paenibacillus plantiphilus]|uniref:Uncharacterized protein n=1 Tax=Paenibacillus plantiphilus TaxID=2905650 RepID=A0ABM9CGM0_9BACL|nr:hypothetical protein PAECIP111893_03461 [Paenibacillus plantiphilus]
MKKILVLIFACALLFSLLDYEENGSVIEEVFFMKKAEKKIESLLKEEVTLKSVTRGKYGIEILVRGYIERINFPFSLPTNDALDFESLKFMHKKIVEKDAGTEFQDILYEIFQEEVKVFPKILIRDKKIEEQYLSYKIYREKYKENLQYTLSIERNFELNEEALSREAKGTYAFIKFLRNEDYIIGDSYIQYANMSLNLKDYMDKSIPLEEADIMYEYKNRVELMAKTDELHSILEYGKGTRHMRVPFPYSIPQLIPCSCFVSVSNWTALSATELILLSCVSRPASISCTEAMFCSVEAAICDISDATV